MQGSRAPEQMKVLCSLQSKEGSTLTELLLEGTSLFSTVREPYRSGLQFLLNGAGSRGHTFQSFLLNEVPLLAVTGHVNVF